MGNDDARRAITDDDVTALAIAYDDLRYHADMGREMEGVQCRYNADLIWVVLRKMRMDPLEPGYQCGECKVVTPLSDDPDGPIDHHPDCSQYGR